MPLGRPRSGLALGSGGGEVCAGDAEGVGAGGCGVGSGGCDGGVGVVEVDDFEGAGCAGVEGDVVAWLHGR